MKLKPGYIATYLLIMAVQVVAGSLCNFTNLIIFSLLPCLVIFLPVSCGSIPSMLIAFGTGFVVDFLTDGALCLSVVALLPVALLRYTAIKVFLGREIISRNEDVSIVKHGWMKVLILSAVLNAVYLVIYIWVDGAGKTPLWYGAVQFLSSLIVNTLVSLPVSSILSNSRELKVWR